MDSFKMTVSRKAYFTPNKDEKYKAATEIQNEYKTNPQTLNLTLPALADLVSRGHCIRSAVLSPMNESNITVDKDGKQHYSTEKAFIEQTAVFLDFDNKTDPPMQEFMTADGVRDFVNKKLGTNAVSMVSESSTSSEALRKWHVIMILDKPQSDLALMKAALKNLVDETFKGTADKACKDPARIAFGSTPDKITKIYDGILPFEIIKAPEITKSQATKVPKKTLSSQTSHTHIYAKPIQYDPDNDFSKINVPKTVQNEAKKIAKQAYLPNVAALFGLEFEQCGSEFRCVQQNSLTVYYKNGYKFKNFGDDLPTSRGVIKAELSGDPITFVMNAGNMSYIEALNFLSDNYIIKNLGLTTNQPAYNISDNIPNPPPSEKKSFSPPIEEKFTHEAIKRLQVIHLHPENNADAVNAPKYEHCIQNSRAFQYLTQQRGLHPYIISYLMKNGFIAMEEKTNNVIFKIFNKFEDLNDLKRNGTDNFSRELKAVEKIGTGIKKFKCKQIDESGYGFELCRAANPDKIMLFESAVDMLSFMQMYKGDGFKGFRFISMNGCTPNLAEAIMKRYNIPPQKVYIATDNDPAGNSFASKFMKKYNIPPTNRKTPAIGKDWNDQLRVQTGMITAAQLEEDYRRKEQEKAEKKTGNKFDSR